MKSLKKQRRIQVILLAVVSLAVATALIGYAFQDGINLYRSPSQTLAEAPAPDEVFRLGGLVEAGSLERGAGEVVRFRVTDGGASIPVRFKGILPALFEEDQGMIGTGTMVDGTFEASEILAKHDENYMPKEVLESLKEQGVYQPANGQESTD